MISLRSMGIGGAVSGLTIAGVAVVRHRQSEERAAQKRQAEEIFAEHPGFEAAYTAAKEVQSLGLGTVPTRGDIRTFETMREHGIPYVGDGESGEWIGEIGPMLAVEAIFDGQTTDAKENFEAYVTSWDAHPKQGKWERLETAWEDAFEQEMSDAFTTPSG